MKIIFVSDLYYPHIGGISEHIFHLANEFERMGHKVSILTANIEGDLKPDERRVIRIGKSIVIPMNKSNARITYQVKLSLLSEVINKYNIVHIHGTIAPTLPLLALKVSKRTNIFTFHPTFNSSTLYKVFKGYLNHYFRKIHGKIAVSPTAMASISKYFPGEYRIIPNGIDVSRFKIRKVEKNPFEILFVGRIEPRKGLQFLIDALPIIKRRFPKAFLTVAGGGYKSMKIKIPPGVREAVNFLGFVSPSKLPEIFNRASVFVSPAISGESFGIVLLEAMASGIPVLASDIPGYRCVIKNGVNGLLFPPGKPEEIASKVIKLMKDERLRKTLIRGGLNTVERYSWSAIAKEIIKFYYEVSPSLP
ncbi:MAG: glycosyltransferase family 4 protein [candidate division WOR-3 bacterium]